jgi:DNA-binding winged helix-turn-helix (wHTH) protein
VVGGAAVVRFGSFTLDAARRQLTRDGDVVHLTPKAFDLLALLVGEAPRVVPKTELYERLWPQTYISEATLVGLVKELRRALDDHDAGAPVIRTAHRVGYAFSATCEGPPAASSSPLHWILIGVRRVVLHQGDNLIGRDLSSDVWIDSVSVSRRHARIAIGEAGVLIEDCGSKNGTKIGAASVTGQRPLRDGDRLRFGSVQAVYRCSSAGMTTETHAGSTAHVKAIGVQS